MGLVLPFGSVSCLKFMSAEPLSDVINECYNTSCCRPGWDVLDRSKVVLVRGFTPQRSITTVESKLIEVTLYGINLHFKLTRMYLIDTQLLLCTIVILYNATFAADETPQITHVGIDQYLNTPCRIHSVANGLETELG